MVSEVFRRPWFRLLAVLAGVVVFLWLVYRLRDPLTPFAVAFALAYFLNPLTNALERRLRGPLARLPLLSGRLEPRMVAVGLLAVLVAVVVIVALLVLVPAAYHQIAETIAKVPGYVQVLRSKLEPAYQRLHLRYPEATDEVRQRLMTAARTNLPLMVSPLTRGLASAFSSLLSFVLTVLNLVIIPVFAFYLLYDMNAIKAGARDLVPLRFRPYVFSRAAQIDTLLSAFARGQVTVCLMLGAFYSVGLTLCGVPMGLVVGFVIGLFNLIPFMSYILGLPLALLLSWVDDQSGHALLAVVAVFAVGQFVEGNFVTPRIVGQSLGLHAVVIMLAVLVGGTVFGFIGMLLAVPVTAALSVFWYDLRDLYLRSAFYRGPAAEG
jgi:predicted PurR-regulated permease PerM